MAQRDFLPERPEVPPQIYAYSNPRFPGQLKVGYTAHDVQKRIALKRLGVRKKQQLLPPRADEYICYELGIHEEDF